MYSKVDVKGNNIHPIFEYLVNSERNLNKPITWNFDGKFLINKEGELMTRFTNKSDLQEIRDFIWRDMRRPENIPLHREL